MFLRLPSFQLFSALAGLGAQRTPEVAIVTSPVYIPVCSSGWLFSWDAQCLLHCTQSCSAFTGLWVLERKWKCWLLGCVGLFTTPWTVAHQATLSKGFSRQEYWSGLAFPSASNLPDPGIKPRSPTFQADSLPVWATKKAPNAYELFKNSCYKLPAKFVIKVFHFPKITF